MVKAYRKRMKSGTIQLTELKGATSRLAHLEKLSSKFSRSSFAIRFKQVVESNFTRGQNIQFNGEAPGARYYVQSSTALYSLYSASCIRDHVIASKSTLLCQSIFLLTRTTCSLNQSNNQYSAGKKK